MLKFSKTSQEARVTIYTKTSIAINTQHIIEINKQLIELGSKVDDRFLDGKEHALLNILHLAMGGGGTYKVPLEDINKIVTNQFQINLS